MEAADGLATGTGVHGTALIVDDDPVTLSSFSQLLQLRGVTTYGASTGEGAVRSALAHRPDVLVLDNRLGKPGDMTGIDVIDALHVQSFYPTWILYSGFMEFDLAVDAGRRDVFRVVQLPSTDIETVVMTALTAVREGQAGGWPILPVGPWPTNHRRTLPEARVGSSSPATLPTICRAFQPGRCVLTPAKGGCAICTSS